MPTYETPSYLGFADRMPKESPLMSAIEGGMQTYGALQQIKGEKQRQQLEEEKLKQAKMTTETMPGTLERKKTTEEQLIETGKQTLEEGRLKLGALPEELKRKETKEQQAIRQTDMFLKAYPEALKQGLTANELANAQARLQVSVNSMSLQDQKHNKVQNDLADIADIASANPELANKMWQAKRPGWIAYGENSENIPTSYDRNAQIIANQAQAHAPSRSSERTLHNELLKESIHGQALLTEIQLKKVQEGDTYSKKWQEASAEADRKYKTVLNTAASGAMVIKKDTDEMLRLAEKGVGQFGYLSGRTMVLNTTGQENLKAARNLLLDKFAQMPHIGRGGNLLLQIIEQSKPDPKMTYEAYTQMAKSYAAAANYLIERNNFIEEMGNQDVHDETQLENAWNKFENVSDVQDRQGNFNPEVPSQWRSWFAKNLDALPSSLVQKLKGKQIIEREGIKPNASSIPNPMQQQGQNITQQSITKTGVVPTYAGQTPTSLLQGD